MKGIYHKDFKCACLGLILAFGAALFCLAVALGDCVFLGHEFAILGFSMPGIAFPVKNLGVVIKPNRLA
jgi:hypothetical protein